MGGSNLGLILLLSSVCVLLTVSSDLSHSYQENSQCTRPQECRYQEALSPIFTNQGTYCAKCKLSHTGIGGSHSKFFHYDHYNHNVHKIVFYEPFQCSKYISVTNFTNARNSSPVLGAV